MVIRSADPSDARERIVRAAYPLFVQHGIRDTSVEQVREAAGIPAVEFDRLFGSRDELAVAFLEMRESEWTVGIVEAGARSRGTTPEGVLLAIFDVFDEWFHRDDYEACTFINVLLEMGKGHPLGQASVAHLLHIRTLVSTLAAEAGLRDPEEFALSWHILMKGSIINAVEGDRSAALRARAMAEDLIARFRVKQDDKASAERHATPATRSTERGGYDDFDLDYRGNVGSSDSSFSTDDLPYY